jgi:aldehyde dehydrogenase (NAD+)
MSAADVFEKFSILPHRDRIGVKPGRLFIDGAWVEGESGDRWEHRHPATNEVLTTIAIASEIEVDRAVMAARKAFDDGPWPTLPGRDRIAILQRFANRARAEADNLTQLQVLDNSNPVSIQKVNLVANGGSVADVFDHAIGWIDKLTGETIPNFNDPGRPMITMTMREPVGVVAAIIPWNAPLFLLCQKIAPALAAGCTLVIKPSEHTSLTAIRVVELLEQAGLPKGVVNLITGPGNPTGEALIQHPGIDKVTFTGSRAVGQHILHAAADGLKRVSLELGGKSPLIIFSDARDVAAAAAGAMGMISFGMSGQTCAATTRMLVHKSVLDVAVDAAQSIITRVVQGDPFDPATTTAPLISRRQVERVQGFVDRACEDGAELLVGGRPSGGSVAHGNFFQPTIMINVDNDFELAREEVFGPVMSIIPFEDEDEAIRLANDSDYGLAAQIATSDIGRAIRVSRRIRAGTVHVNAATMAPNMPFGGFKQSGLGREGGAEGIAAFLETKTINFAG